MIGMLNRFVPIIFALGMVGALLFLAEFLRRYKLIHGEIARKFVHITVGIFVASWPFFLSLNQIRLLCVAFLIVVLIDRKLKVFKAVHSVARTTFGDIMFPLGIALTTFVTNSPWIFAAAILHLSLGDGVAAIVGTHFAPKYSYKIFGQTKSTVGNLSFGVVSFGIMLALLMNAPVNLQEFAVPLLLLMPLASAALESVSLFGIDNVTVPVFVAMMLSSLQLL